MENVLAVAGWLLLEVIIIATGKAIVAVATLGRWRSEKLGSGEARIYSLAGALTYKQEGQRIVSRTGLFLVGMFWYIGIAVALICLATS